MSEYTCFNAVLYRLNKNNYHLLCFLNYLRIEYPMSKWARWPVLAATFCLVTSGFSVPAGAAGEVNIYSARKEDLIKPLLDDFSKQTGITVNLPIRC